MRNRTYNILFCGTGGQGVLTAAELCGLAAVRAGYHVKKSEVHGMAQRGGSVESHLRFGRQVFSPLIPEGQADFLVCFHPDEHDRLRHFLRPEGLSLRDDLDRAVANVADRRYVNTYLLGALSRHLPIRERCWLEAIETAFARRNPEENLRVFRQGRGSES